MNKRHLLTALAGSSLLLVATAAEAQPRGRGGPQGDRGPQHASMMLLAADANGDRSVTRAEVDDLQAEMFEYMDRNGDGYLDQADQSPVRQRLRAHHEARMEERGGEGHRGRRGRRGGEESRMRAADTDGDERLSRAEFLAMDHPLFDHLDADGNDVISPDELDAAVERRENRGRWWRD